jgi:hypothetical protein
MKVVILAPRLDVPFKNFGPVSEERGPITPLRQHWANIINVIKSGHEAGGDQVTVIEKPLWQFTPDDATGDANYVPHKNPKNFVPKELTFYYMQTVFPEYFTIDTKGWGVDCSFFPLQPIDHPDQETTERISKFVDDRISNNTSKFDQPDAGYKYTGDFDIFFPCQIPDDEVILNNSDHSVEDALDATLSYASKCGMSVLVKGHPANPGKMGELKKVWEKYAQHSIGTLIWADDISVHEAIRHSKATFLVNSGVGIEAIMHGKPVYHFGRSEYDEVSYKLIASNPEIMRQQIFDFGKRPISRGKQIDFLDKYLKNLVKTT